MKHCLQEMKLLPHMTNVAMPCESAGEQKFTFVVNLRNFPEENPKVLHGNLYTKFILL